MYIIIILITCLYMYFKALWILLDKHQSPPLSDDEQLINYEDFKKVIEEAGPKYRFIYLIFHSIHIS